MRLTMFGSIIKKDQQHPEKPVKSLRKRFHWLLKILNFSLNSAVHRVPALPSYRPSGSPILLFVPDLGYSFSLIVFKP